MRKYCINPQAKRIRPDIIRTIRDFFLPRQEEAEKRILQGMDVQQLGSGWHEPAYPAKWKGGKILP